MSGAPALFLESQLFKIFSHPANMFCQEAGKHFSNFSILLKKTCMCLSSFFYQSSIRFASQVYNVAKKSLAVTLCPSAKSFHHPAVTSKL